MANNNSDKEYQDRADARPYHIAYWIIGLIAFIILVIILIQTNNAVYIRDMLTIAAVVIGGVGAIYMKGRGS